MEGDSERSRIYASKKKKGRAPKGARGDPVVGCGMSVLLYGFI